MQQNWEIKWNEYVNMLGMRGANDVYQLLAGGRYVALK